MNNLQPLKTSRIFGLDILRAAAILLVLFAHSIYFLTNSWDNFFLPKFLPDGVSVFFVLSGFLIGNILITTIQKTDFGWDDLKNFWIRRWFRTLPAYYFVLTVLLIIRWMISQNTPSLEYLKYYLFLQAFLDGSCYLYAESWSLCVEEWFYLTIPAFLFLFIKYSGLTKKNILLSSILIVLILGTVFTIVKIDSQNYMSGEDWDRFIRKTVFTRLHSIMYGFLGAYLRSFHYDFWKYKQYYFFTGVLLFLFMGTGAFWGVGPYINNDQLTLTLSLEAIATLLLIPQLCSIVNGEGPAFKFITFVSSISYSVYLINFTPFYTLEFIVSSLLDFKFESFPYLRVGLFLSWSIGVGYLMHRYIEIPLIKMRELFSHKEFRQPLETTPNNTTTYAKSTIQTGSI